MKAFIKLLKILLPSFIPMLVFSLIAKQYRDVDGGDGNLLHSLIFYYRHMMPVLFIIAVIMQYLIIVPLWNKALAGDWVRKVILFSLLILFCIVIAAGISYAIWDEATGAVGLQNSIFTITIIQLAFWLIDITVLTLLSAIQKAEPPKEGLDT
ncbi:hypothetical protein KXQ82_08600 [Mucilaginibacter sp. HMF5004]|uniref:hypothetical protein n=1 Tax=Mucilaginibacter rivuli TaxID=2857527 RepID=UPI001C5F7A6F|nr:hypothetical protein [Mucilaginibacter rivuli]MBW4889773.1 hypothetical protein [Mucilaginibacter rivuli]